MKVSRFDVHVADKPSRPVFKVRNCIVAAFVSENHTRASCAWYVKSNMAWKPRCEVAAQLYE